MDWEQIAKQAKAELALAIAEIKRYREAFENIKQQLFLTEALKQNDGLDKYRHTYP